MKNTRLMDRLFSATDEQDSELTAQVAEDIEAARDGKVETEELVFENCGDGRVAITDKENGEVTVAEKADDGNYDLSAWEPTEQIEQFIHPEEDGVTPGQAVGAPDETAEDHLAGAGMAEVPTHEVVEDELAEHDGVCSECGKEPCECGEDEKEFSVATDNTVVQRIFSDQAFCERLFAEVIESEETTKVGDLKIEKIEGEDAVLVSSESTGDQAKVELDDKNLNVTELAPKEFSEEGVAEEESPEQFEPLHVVGVDAGNHVLVDASEFDPESAQELAQQLTEDGVDAVEIFENEDEARDYAMNLLENLGAEEVDEPEEKEFSDCTLYFTRYYSNNTCLMDRLFSEACNDVQVSQDAIEDAIENGDQIETDDEIITPIDIKSAVIEDKETGEFTRVDLSDDAVHCKPIPEEMAEDLMENLDIVDEDEKEYSDVYSNDDETKFFSEDETLTDYMVKLFSEEASEEEIEDAIEKGEEIENDSEIITPIDARTAVVEDKESGEFTKAIMDDDKLDLEPISKDEAEDLTGDLAVGDEKDFSDTDYMTRIFSEEASEGEVEDAIESGEQIENDTEVITPIDAKTAVVEDKDNGEFTKAVMEDGDVKFEHITEKEADELTEDLAVEDAPEEKEDSEKEFSTPEYMNKFFAEVMPQGAPQAAPQGVAVLDANGQPVQIAVDENGQPISAEQAQAVEAPAVSVEAIEDKALAAVQSIQAAASEAEAQILNAKAAPVENAEQDLQEAQFSDVEDENDAEERIFSDSNDTLVSWLKGTQYGK